jgi:hypothetical protein
MGEEEEVVGGDKREDGDKDEEDTGEEMCKEDGDTPSLIRLTLLLRLLLLLVLLLMRTSLLTPLTAL